MPPTPIHAFLPHPISLVAHDIRSAHNVGSLLRTADSAGFRHVYLTGYSATPGHRGVRKTALGAQHSIAWSHHEDPLLVIGELRAEGITVVALERTDDAVDFQQIQAANFPMALVVGNEVLGVPRALIEAAALTLAIPQYGEKASLNVSVAFGIAAYGLVERFRATR